MNRSAKLLTALLLAASTALHGSQDAIAAQPASAAIDFDLQGLVDGRLKTGERQTARGDSLASRIWIDITIEATQP